MKKLITICFIFCGLFSNVALAESIAFDEDSTFVDHSPIIESSSSADDENAIYILAEKMPQFPGGEQEMRRFITKNLRYPRNIENIQGRVVVKFVIEKDGSITNIEVMRSPHESLSKEVIRLIESMPNWISGEQNGKPVRTRFILPIFIRV